MKEKLRASHLSRRAIVYLRQSSMRQVHEHRESTARQYALSDRAVGLGWPAHAVDVIDEDLGQSGAGTSWRPGFKRMAKQVTSGTAGAVFALEVSRFARSSADWHRLLELCRWSDVLIIDENGIFDPSDPNDLLLLGFKGQMSEAEKQWLTMRMQGARMNKAKRGELRLTPPSGYQWDEFAGRLCFDPDEQIQHALCLLFRRFRIDGTANAAIRYFIDNDLRFPVRHLASGETRWGNPIPSTIGGILRSPIYAGAYVYGRRESKAVIIDNELHRSRITRLPEESWKVCIHDHHAAYVTWDEYVDNQRRLHDNRSMFATTGAPRPGSALLQGILLCGKCGFRMNVEYAKGRQRYICRAPILHGKSASRCWSVTGVRIDEAVGEAFLEAVQPTEIELSLAVAREAEHQAGEVSKQWRMRLERARYEAGLAERRYKAVDPDNRIVANTLERDWEHKLRDLADVERGYDDARNARKVDVSDADRDRVFQLAKDLPGIWRAPTTSDAQRKTLLRTLIRGVTITPVDVPTRATRIEVLWVGGAITERTIDRPRWVSGCQASDEADARIRDLVARGIYDDTIATVLNEQKLVTGGGQAWDRTKVERVRRRLGLRRPQATLHKQILPAQRADGLYSTLGVAERFGVLPSTVRRWNKLGWLLTADGGQRGCPSWFRLDKATIARILQKSSTARLAEP